MKPKDTYLVFCVLGAIVPYWQFIRWLTENGFNLSLFVQHLFANRISTFFVLDVVISALVLLRFISVEGARLHLKRRWLVSLSVILVGVSLGLPLFLYLRERELEQAKS
jgi:Terpene cyclase DEP1